MNQRKEDTALGVARARFVDSLSSKADEIGGAVEALRAAPDDPSAREDLRKRFHALYASAQVFRIQELAQELKRCLVLIDDARDATRALEGHELDDLKGVLGSFTELATGQRPSIIPNMDDAVENSRYSVPRPSALGIETKRPPPPAAPSPRAKSSPGVPAAPRRSASSPGVPAAPRRPASSPDFPAAAPPPRAATSPSFPAVRPPAPSRPKSSPGVPAARSPSSGGLSVPRSPSSGGFKGASAKSSAFVPKAGSIPPARPRPEKRLVASRGPVKVEVESVLSLLMVGGEPIAQRLATAFPPNRVDILHSANEREAVEAARRHSPDAVVVAPSFAHLVADAFAEAGLSGAPRVQLTPPNAASREYELAGVRAVLPVNAPPSKMGRAIVEMALASGSLEPRSVSPGPARSSGDLTGVEAVVAFDEPGITHFVSLELERAGATVHRASEGARALALTRAHRPAIVLASESLPAVSGPELARRVSRDPLLVCVSAFVLSIGDECRAKMRAAPAEGAERDEAGAGFIRDLALEASARRRGVLESLRAGALRSGRLRGVGADALLSALAEAGADVRVELRDTERVLELELRGGAPEIATFTASTGEFVRGDRAFERAASFTRGRFRVEASEGEPKGPSIASGALERLAAELARRSVLVELFEGGAIEGAPRIEIDPSVAASAGLDERTLSELEGEKPLGAVVSTLGGEERLVDLARLGAITSLLGEGGADLVAAGLARRGEPLPAEDAEELIETTPGSLEAPEPLELDIDDLDVEPAAELSHSPEQPVPVAPPPPGEPAAAEQDPREPVDHSAEAAIEPVAQETSAGQPPEPAEPAPIALSLPPEPGEPRTAKKRPRGAIVGLLATAVVAGIGFAAVEFLDLRALVGSSGAPGDGEGITEERSAAPDPGERAEAARREEPKLEDPFPALPGLYGERREGTSGHGVNVPEGQGLLVVEAPPEGESPKVYVGGELLGSVPVSKAFSPGRHEVVLELGSEKRYRYVFVEPGVTRVLPTR